MFNCRLNARGAMQSIEMRNDSDLFKPTPLSSQPLKLEITLSSSIALNLIGKTGDE